MSARAADDFDAIRARVDELRQARELDEQEIAARAQDWSVSAYEARRRLYDRDYDRGAVGLLRLQYAALFDRLVAEGLVLGVTTRCEMEAENAALLVLVDLIPPVFGAPVFVSHPIPAPRARAHACEGLWGETRSRLLASPRVEEPESEISEIRDFGHVST